MTNFFYIRFLSEVMDFWSGFHWIQWYTHQSLLLLEFSVHFLIKLRKCVCLVWLLSLLLYINPKMKFNKAFLLFKNFFFFLSRSHLCCFLYKHNRMRLLWSDQVRYKFYAVKLFRSWLICKEIDCSMEKYLGNHLFVWTYAYWKYRSSLENIE